MSKGSSEKLGKIPPRAAFLEEKPSFHRGKGGSWKSRVCFYENSSPIRATIFPLTKQDTESLSRYGCFAYRSSQLFLFSQCNEFRFNALSLLPPSPIDSRVRPDGILRNEWARRRHERRRVIEPLKLSFADPNFVAVWYRCRYDARSTTFRATFRPYPSLHFIGGRRRYVLDPKLEKIDGCTKWKMFDDRRCCDVEEFPRRQLITTYTMYIF